MVKLAITIIVSTILMALPAGGAASISTPLTMQELFRMIRVPSQAAGPTLSPDGKLIAYTTLDASAVKPGDTHFDFEGIGLKQLWVLDIDSGQATRIGGAAVDSWAPAWSPDGKHLAYYEKDGGKQHLWLWDRATRIAHRVSRFEIRHSNGWQRPSAQWVPGSKFVIEQLVPLKEAAVRAAPAKHKKFSDVTVTVFENHSDLKQAGALGVAIPNPTTTSSNRVIEPISQMVLNSGPNTDLALIDTSDGLVRRIVPNVRPTDYVLSPDGTRLLYSVDKGSVNQDVNNREIFDFYTVALETGAVRRVVTDAVTSFSAPSLSWSPDSRKICFVGSELAESRTSNPESSGASDLLPGSWYFVSADATQQVVKTEALFMRTQSSPFWDTAGRIAVVEATDQKTLWKVSASDGTASKLATIPGRSLWWKFLIDRAGLPANVSQGRSFYLDASDDLTGEQLIYKVDVDSGTATQLLGGFQNRRQFDLAPSGEVSYVAENASHPPDVWIAASDFKNPRQVTHLNPQIDRHTLGSVRSVSWQANADAYGGALLLPAGYQVGKRYPTIVWVYGGEKQGTTSIGLFGTSFSEQAAYFNFQLLATRGYAVFIPDSKLRVGSPMRDLADVVLPGVDKVVEMGIADPNRLGVWGQSYGGYSTMALLVQTTRFKVAVAMSGIYDIFAMHGTMYDDGSDWVGWAEDEQGRMGGSPWQYRDRYIENSPYFFLDRIQTPVLLEYGATDKFAQINAEQAFVGLRRLGKDVTLLRYAKEDHVLLAPANQLDLMNRILAWFGKYLG